MERDEGRRTESRSEGQGGERMEKKTDMRGEGQRV